jgi:hypothetical protein
MKLQNIEMVKECSETKANELLANGWVLISAGVSNWSDGNSVTMHYYSEVIYILGKPSEQPTQPTAPAEIVLCARCKKKRVFSFDRDGMCPDCTGIPF